MHALAFTLGAFALILILARLKVPLAAAIAVGALAVGFVFRLTVSGVFLTALTGVIQPRTIGLAVVTLFLLGLSGLMQASGQFEEIVGLAKALLRRPSVAMAALPALIGLLPMPGGALFSAPMVESAAGEGKASGGVLSAINYWFRHIWEHWWPLYPGVLLAMTLTETSYGQFVRFQVPLGAFMVASGFLLFRGTHADLHRKAAPAPEGTKRRLMWAISPILIILIVWVPTSVVIGRWVAPRLPDLWQSVAAKYVPLILGLIGGMVWTVFLKRLEGRVILRNLFSARAALMAVLVLSVMVFQYMLEQVEAARGIADELTALKVPVVLVVAVLPYIAGLVTGLAIGFVGTSFPILVELVRTLPNHGSILVWVALAYGFGHLGQMSSPIHVCHIVSNQYFKTGFGPVYRRIVPAMVVCACMVAGYFLLLRIVV